NHRTLPIIQVYTVTGCPGGAARPGAWPEPQGGPDMRMVATSAGEPSARPTLEAWSMDYLGFTVHLKAKTRAIYESLLRARILPAFGLLPLDAIDGLAVRRWIAEMHSHGLSASSVRQSHRLLSQ